MNSEEALSLRASSRPLSRFPFAFEAAPSADGALLFGMCASDSSLNLLVRHEKTTDSALMNAIHLARARRGDVAAEQEFIEKFKLQPIGRGMLTRYGADSKSVESVRHLEYIGSGKCLLTLLDAIVSVNEKEETAVRSTAAALMVKMDAQFS